MHMKSERGSMAVYVSIVLLTMLLVLMAIFLTSNSTRKMQLVSAMNVKSSYEVDNARAADIYDELSGNAGANYVSDGLILHYDAINNTGNGHSTTATTWKDLSGNNRDCNLLNLNNNGSSGWTTNSLILDGTDDYGLIQNLNLTGNNEITIYVTYKVLSVDHRARLQTRCFVQ